MKDLNLDAHQLVEHLMGTARESSLEGRVVVSSFGESQLEDHARIVFDAGHAFIQRPVLWPDLQA